MSWNYTKRGVEGVWYIISSTSFSEKKLCILFFSLLFPHLSAVFRDQEGSGDDGSFIWNRFGSYNDCGS